MLAIVPDIVVLKIHLGIHHMHLTIYLHVETDKATGISAGPHVKWQHPVAPIYVSIWLECTLFSHSTSFIRSSLSIAPYAL